MAVSASGSGLGRIARLYAGLVAARRGALCAYLPAGDPQAGDLLTLARQIVDGGAQLIELGLPGGEFAHEPLSVRGSLARAAARGSHLYEVLTAASLVRHACPETILVLLAEAQGLDSGGADEVARRCVEAGLDGVLLTMPDGGALRESLRHCDLGEPGYVPTASAPGVLAARTATGYAVLSTPSTLVDEHGDVAPHHGGVVRRLRATGLTLPLLLRFGAATPAQATAALALGADGISVSAGVLAHLRDREGLLAYLRGLSAALAPGAILPPAARD